MSKTDFLGLGENVPSFFRNVIRDAQQACVAAAQRGGTLASERKIAWADIDDSSGEEKQHVSKKKSTST